MDFTSTALWIIVIGGLFWLVLLATSLYGLVKRNDIGLPVKIFWGLVICFAPVIGLIAYVLLRRNTARSRQSSSRQV
jgi:hypothetical protein